jgi:hypothetical protein
MLVEGEMVAPGDSLEFSEGPAFKRHVRQVPGLGDAIRAYYAAQPRAMDSVSPRLLRGRLDHDGRCYEFLLGRRGPTKVYLFFVVEVFEGQGISLADMDHFIANFG